MYRDFLNIHTEHTNSNNPQQPQMTSVSGIDDGKILIKRDQLLMCMIALYAEFTSNDNPGSSQQP